MGGLRAGQIGPVLEPCGETKIKPPYEETDVSEEQREAGGPLFSSSLKGGVPPVT